MSEGAVEIDDYPARQRRQEALMEAARRGDAAAVLDWVALGADPGKVGTGESGEPMTALGQAIERGRTAAVEALAPLRDLDECSEKGMPALMWAVDCHAPDCVAALLAAGADPEAQDKAGWTALMLAMRLGGSDWEGWDAGQMSKTKQARCLDALLDRSNFQLPWGVAKSLVEAAENAKWPNLATRMREIEALRERSAINAGVGAAKVQGRGSKPL